MAKKRILSLDVGMTTGWAIVDVKKGSFKAVSYGILPVVGGSPSHFRRAAREWLAWATDEFELATSSADIVIETTSSMFPQEEAMAMQDGILSWCRVYKPVDTYVYVPAMVRTILSIDDDADAKVVSVDMVRHALGYTPVGPDHVIDAFTAALAHTIHQKRLDMSKVIAVPPVGVKNLAGGCV